MVFKYGLCTVFQMQLSYWGPSSFTTWLEQVILTVSWAGLLGHMAGLRSRQGRLLALVCSCSLLLRENPR